jgi:hypothetical protein
MSGDAVDKTDKWLARATGFIAVGTAASFVSTSIYNYVWFQVVGWELIGVLSSQDYILGAVQWLPVVGGFFLFVSVATAAFMKFYGVFVMWMRRRFGRLLSFVTVILIVVVALVFALIADDRIAGTFYEECMTRPLDVKWSVLLVSMALSSVFLPLLLTSLVPNGQFISPKILNVIRLAASAVLFVIIPFMSGQKLACRSLIGGAHYMVIAEGRIIADARLLRIVGNGVLFVVGEQVHAHYLPWDQVSELRWLQNEDSVDVRLKRSESDDR